MTNSESIRRYLLNRELTMWHNEAERTENRLGDPQQGGSKAAIEQAWYDYCCRKHEEVGWELDKVENPQKYPAANVARDDSLDDLDRQRE
ncbi:MAG: hypothetical protein JOZ49_24220 [Mycolicibacterium sp.]|nr:hypothetical protein [Mycolicibacterium sp.]